jgi:predicted CXXCH cytochrome family protein
VSRFSCLSGEYIAPLIGRDIFKFLYTEVMCNLKNRYFVKSWIKPSTKGIVILVFLGIFFISCDEVQRHETLTFFFDGVPPLQPNIFQEGLVDSNSFEPNQPGQEPVWYAHEPTRDCSNCHTKRKKRSFSPQTHLKAPIPKLCYTCHDDFTKSALFVHGPVAVGQCTFCHNPHRSKIKHLLVTPEPGLCYQCHDKNTIELIAAHLPKQLSSCTDCHNPHTSSTKSLLRDSAIRTYEEAAQPSTPKPAPQENIQVTEESKKQADTELEVKAPAPANGSKKLTELFQQTSRLIEQGQLHQAKAYLEKFKDSDSFTAEQKQQIKRIIGMIDSAINNEKQQAEKDKQSDKRIKEISDLYYTSMAYYRTGQLIKAKEGFIKVLNSGLIPEPMAKTIRGYVTDIENSLAGKQSPEKPKQ